MIVNLMLNDDKYLKSKKSPPKLIIKLIQDLSTLLEEYWTIYNDNDEDEFAIFSKKLRFEYFAEHCCYKIVRLEFFLNFIESEKYKTLSENDIIEVSLSISQYQSYMIKYSQVMEHVLFIKFWELNSISLNECLQFIMKEKSDNLAKYVKKVAYDEITTPIEFDIIFQFFKNGKVAQFPNPCVLETDNKPSIELRKTFLVQLVVQTFFKEIIIDNDLKIKPNPKPYIIYDVFTAITKNKNLAAIYDNVEHIEIRGLKIDIKSARILSDYIMRSDTALRSFSMSFCSFQDQAFSIICEGIQNNSNIRILEIHSNIFNSDDLKELMKAIKKKKYDELTYYGNNVKGFDKDAEIFHLMSCPLTADNFNIFKPLLFRQLIEFASDLLKFYWLHYKKYPRLPKTIRLSSSEHEMTTLDKMKIGHIYTTISLMLNSDVDFEFFDQNINQYYRNALQREEKKTTMGALRFT